MLKGDRLCREKAIEKFKPIHDAHKNIFLHLNVNEAILPLLDFDNLTLPDQLESMGVDPRSVVVESRNVLADTELLAQLFDMFRGLGIKLCLDGCAVDDSFNYAITKGKPDFVKVTRSFFGETERAGYSQKTLEALISVADQVGASIIGQGVETEDESIRLLLSGVDLQQGYYYTKGESRQPVDPAKIFMEKIVETHDKYRKVKKRLIRKKKERVVETFKDVSAICSKLSNTSEVRFEEGCKTLVRTVDGVISLFVLDDQGKQITSRVRTVPARRSSALLRLTKGAEHSTEDYFVYLDIGYEQFVTPPFASPFTDVQACLISRAFYNTQGGRFVACVEVPYPG